MPPPKLLYKYLEASRLAVATNFRIRFSQRIVFKDDHELLPDYLTFGTFDEIKRHIVRTGGSGMIRGVSDDQLAWMICKSPKHQQTAKNVAIQSIKVRDELGILCLTVNPTSERMWIEYAGDRTGFVIGFDTAHTGFGAMTAPLGVLPVTYSSDGFPTFLGMVESNPFEPLYRRRTDYSFEQEWRCIRLLKNLERHAENVYLSAFDPGCVARIIIGANCGLESQLRELGDHDNRFRHVEISKL